MEMTEYPPWCLVLRSTWVKEIFMDPLKIYLRLIALEIRVAEIGANLGHLRDGLRTIDTELLMLMSDLEKQILEEEGDQDAEANRRRTHRPGVA